MKIIKSPKGRGLFCFRRHYESVHDVGNKVTCSKCGQIAKNKYALIIHNRKHKK